MFRGVLSLLLLGVAASLSRAAEPPGEVYLNRTSVVNPMVNHRHFINEGEFTAFGELPWDGQNLPQSEWVAMQVKVWSEQIFQP